MFILSGRRAVCFALALLAARALHGQQPGLALAVAELPNGSAIASGTTSMEALDSSYKIGQGDRLSYRVVEERREITRCPWSWPTAARWMSPSYGRVSARGRTCKELAQAIKPLLERDYFNKATVIIALDVISTKRSRQGIPQRTGQTAEGPVDIPPDERFTLSKAILRAGGLMDFANHKKITLSAHAARWRPSGTTQYFNLDDVTKRGNLDKDPELLPDDRIIVPEKFVNL